MRQYEMDLPIIVSDNERARFCPKTERQADGQIKSNIPSILKLR